MSVSRRPKFTLTHGSLAALGPYFRYFQNFFEIFQILAKLAASAYFFDLYSRVLSTQSLIANLVHNGIFFVEQETTGQGKGRFRRGAHEQEQPQFSDSRFWRAGRGSQLLAEILILSVYSLSKNFKAHVLITQRLTRNKTATDFRFWFLTFESYQKDFFEKIVLGKF